MALVRFPRCTPSLLQLEDRCTPTQIFTVFDKTWNPLTKGSLPWAIAQANSAAFPGLDIINFDYDPKTGLGPKPTLTSTDTLFVTEGVHIIGVNNTDYVTIDGVRPFEFTHGNPAPGEEGAPPSTDSQVIGITFSKCAAPGAQSGGAVVVTGGTLTLDTVRFLGNSAQSGGAVFVGLSSTLVVDGFTPGPPDYHPAQAQPRTLFKDNNAADGGAIETRGTVSLNRAWFIENKATNDGGAIGVNDTGVLVAPPLPGPEGPVDPDVQFLGNQAANKGGGVYFNADTSSKLRATIFANNTATMAGGAFAVHNGTVTVSGGIVAALGAGVHIEGSPGQVATVNATGVSFFGNLDLVGNKGKPVEIGDDGILNTSGCSFNGWGLPGIIGTNGKWNSDGTDIP